MAACRKGSRGTVSARACCRRAACPWGGESRGCVDHEENHGVGGSRCTLRHSLARFVCEYRRRVYFRLRSPSALSAGQSRRADWAAEHEATEGVTAPGQRVHHGKVTPASRFGRALAAQAHCGSCFSEKANPSAHLRLPCCCLAPRGAGAGAPRAETPARPLSTDKRALIICVPFPGHAAGTAASRLAPCARRRWARMAGPRRSRADTTCACTAPRICSSASHSARCAEPSLLPTCRW